MLELTCRSDRRHGSERSEVDRPLPTLPNHDSRDTDVRQDLTKRPPDLQDGVFCRVR